MHSLRACLLLLFLAIVDFCVAQPTQMRFDHIGIEQGLSDNFIEDALQDEYGYIWIATAHGLNRYDGKACKIYNAIGKDLLSLDHVNGLMIDHTKKLWICSRLNGILTYNFENEEFKRISFPDANKDDFIFKNSVRQLVESYNHDVWAVNIYGVARYIPSKNQWKWYTKTLDSKLLLRNYNFSITESHDSVLFVGQLSSGLLYYYDRKNDGFRVFNGKEKSHKPLTQTITCILNERNGNLWYGSMESGLVCYNSKSGIWKNYKMNSSSDSLKSNHISCLFVDTKNNLWVGTINGGLSFYDRTNDRFLTSMNDEVDGNSLSSNSISCVFEDKEQNLCVTTHNGLNVLNKQKNLFALFTKSSHKNEVISHNFSSCFYEAPNGIIWIAIDGGGLQKYNPVSGEFTVYDTKNGLSSNGVLDIEPNGDGQLWLATWGGGISLFNPTTGTFKNFTTKNSALNYDNVKGLCKDGDYLWIGTHGMGINIYDCKKRVFYNKANPSSLFNLDLGKAIWINDITKDSKSNFWIYTTVGMYRYDGKRLFEYLPSQNNSLTLSGLHVKKVLEDSKGNIWVASNGLDLYNAKKNCFERFSQKNKDLPKVVNSIEEASDGNLWLSSNDGLYCYNIKTNDVKKFTESDGLQSNRFIERSSLKSKNGLLYFGGLKGFNIYNPTKITGLKSVAKVHIRSCKTMPLSVQNQLSDIQGIEYIHQKSIKIPYSGSQFISFEFIAATLQEPELIHYSVRLLGFEDVDRQLGEQTTITYTNLRPGKYTLQVRASNSRGNEQSQSTELQFEILKPWYQTLLFKVFVSLLLTLLGFFIVQFRTRILAKRNLDLEKLVNIRTEQLEEQKSLIESKNKELSNTINTRDKLLAIVSHDLKNPLSALCGYATILESQLETMSIENLKKMVNQIGRSSNVLQHQVVSLLDWAVMQSGSLVYEPTECNARLIAIDVVSLLQPISEQKSISISINSTITKTVWCDARMLSTIIRNIVGNSLKFTHKGGEIKIEIAENNAWAIITIQDNGIGISSEKINKLFSNETMEISYGTDNEKGIGLGLKICKEFISRNNGQITVESAENEWTRMTILFPLGNKAIEAESSIEQNALVIPSIEQNNSKHVLIVEDNAEIQAMIIQALAPYFYIESATDGEIGFKKALEIIPDIILSDIEMPNTSGIELCKMLKNNSLTNHIPIIIISGNTKVTQQVEGLQLGVDDYVTKPFNVEVLRAKIQVLLQNREKYAQHIRLKLSTEPEIKDVLSSDELFVQKVVKLLEMHLSEPNLSVEFIADQLCVSRQQVSRKLKAIIGQTPVDFIRSFRLKKAESLLKTNRYRISEVAYEVGFSDPKYFTTCITKEFGVNPSQYIKDKEAE